MLIAVHVVYSEKRRRIRRSGELDASNQAGSVLLEFACVALLFYLLAAGTISFGQAAFTLQVTQDAARLMARELAVLPLPSGTRFEVLVGSEAPSAEEQAAVELVRTRVYNPDCLAVDIEAVNFDSTCPLVNQALRPVMIFDDSQGVRLLRYPGALRSNPDNPLSGYSVGLPLITSRDENGVETISWIPVVEEIPGVSGDPFLVSNGGVVALRINYPFQSALLSAFMNVDSSDPFRPNAGHPVLAEDNSVDIESGSFSPAGTQIDDVGAGPYRGPFGLGKQYALGREVRPFRRLFSLQALFRREIFVP